MLSTAFLLNYLRERDDDQVTEAEVEQWRSAAYGYIRSNTGRDNAFIDAHDEFVPAICALVAEMHDNRQYTVPNGTTNPMVDIILGMHAVNLL